MRRRRTATAVPHSTTAPCRWRAPERDPVCAGVLALHGASRMRAVGTAAQMKRGWQQRATGGSGGGGLWRTAVWTQGHRDTAAKQAGTTMAMTARGTTVAATGLMTRGGTRRAPRATCCMHPRGLGPRLVDHWQGPVGMQLPPPLAPVWMGRTPRPGQPLCSAPWQPRQLSWSSTAYRPWLF